LNKYQVKLLNEHHKMLNLILKETHYEKLDLSLSWGFLGRIKEESWNTGWGRNIWHYGVVPV